ncbi:MAG: YkgJ family cysteine cluster protein [Cryomorphaceae bacterium]|nr:YkgJ family cysteine cluster protein [Cryomorphaceae bacterium]
MSKKKKNPDPFALFKKTPPKTLDREFARVDTEVFADFDCLSCANCCKTTGPLFTGNDIDRIAKHLRLKPGAFTQKYLRIDEDNDYVLQTLPCPFLLNDNRCSIYEVRPKACRAYPHTHQKRQHQILNLTQKNVAICPAAEKIVQRVYQNLQTT